MDWRSELLDFRARKDAHFASGRGPISDPSSFKGLTYFPPDPTWNMQLEVRRVAPEAVTLATTTPDEHQEFITWGTVTLPSGEYLMLYARQADAPNAVFVPFRDATSGHSTYGAGRYLDAPLSGDTVQLDFNRTYQPYCAYSQAWTCPLPPAENWLSVAIEAGEKLPEQR